MCVVCNKSENIPDFFEQKLEVFFTDINPQALCSWEMIFKKRGQ